MEVLNNSDVENNFTHINSDIDRGDGEKYLAMTILGFGSFITGMLPALISERNRRRFPLSTSVLLCFGAGILLATALVHILPEVRQQMSSNYAEISLCAGFFIIYFIDEFIHYFFGDPGHHTTPFTTTGEEISNTNRNYGTVNTEREHLLATTSNDNISQQTLCTHHINIRGSHNHTNRINIEQQGNHSHSHTHDHRHLHGHGQSNTNIDSVDNEHMCYVIHAEPCIQQTLSGTLGLFVALSMHSAIEGLAIGVQNSASKVLFLLGAVACHKFVMGFCLGLEFRTSAQTNLRTQFIGILVFALGAVCGIGIGMIIVDIPTKWATTTLPVIQALAGGTLLYVTVCEVIPREKARWHQNSRKIAGFSQFLAVCCGFVAMTLINFYVGDNDA